MKTNNQKGFIVSLFLGIIAVLIIGGGAYIYTNKKVEKVEIPTATVKENVPVINSFSSLNDHGTMYTVINGSNFNNFALVQLLSNGQIVDSFCGSAEGSGTKLSFTASSPETPGFYSNVNQLRVVNVDCRNYKNTDDISRLSSKIINITFGKDNLITFKVSSSDWKTYTNIQYGFEFVYPNVLTLKNITNGFSLSHSVPFKHTNPCDLKNGASIDAINDFGLTGTVADGKIEEAIRSANYYGVTFDSNGRPVIDINSGVKEFNIGKASGYLYSMGVEGCGVDVYYLSLKNDSTLILRNSWVGEFSNSSKGEYDNIAGIILPEKRIEYFNKILSTFKFTN